MLDRAKFMETLRSVAEIARVSTQPLTKEEINGYFDDMELTSEQQEMVYQYLLNPQTEEDTVPETEEAKDTSEDEEDADSQKPEESKENAKDSAYLKMYLEEIKDIEGMSLPEEQEAYVKLIDGDATISQKISDHWLMKVVDIARTYEKHNVNLEDIIQEGNIGLLMGINALHGSHKMIDVEEYLKESVQKSIEDFIDEMNTEDDWESTMLAKSTLIHEAKKALTEQLGHEPTHQELSDFTKIPLEEIQDILHLSLEDETSQVEAKEPKKDASIDPWAGAKELEK